jgi:hypothetical protein
MERGDSNWTRGFLRAFFWVYGNCPLYFALEAGRVGWLGVALSTTSVAVVYAVMLELGFNVTDFGKAVLAACFVNDLGTVIALGLIFSPFTLKTLIFIGVSVVVFAILPFLTPDSSRSTEDVFPSWRRNTYSSYCLQWEDWRFGPAAKQSCQPTSSEWYWPEPWEKTTVS